MALHPTTWLTRLKAWRSSIHAYLQALSLAVIAALATLNLISRQLYEPDPASAPVSVYEMSRLAKGQPLTRPIGTVSASRGERPPFESRTELDRLLARQLALRLGLAEADVRFAQFGRSTLHADQVAREIALYGSEGFANSAIRGGFSLAVRDGSGWRVITRPRDSSGLPVLFWYGIAAGAILALLLSLWFSARLAQTIRTFATAVRRIPGGHAAVPVPVRGPTEIRLAAEALNEMQARIARYVRERTTLTGAIAHDLRAPLSRLRFRLLAAPASVRGPGEEEIREIERMIESVLNFVEHDVRLPASEPLNLSALVESIADDFADTGQDVQVVAPEAIRTRGDPLLLRRLFVNVIENAVKYGGSAAVSVTRSGDDAVIEVGDRGPGMSAEAIGRAFEPFFRVEPSRNRKHGGVGLGLAIAESAAIAHGGSVSLANAPKGGLLARIVIPIVAIDPGAAPQELQVA